MSIKIPNMHSLTAHCLVKNEENFIAYAVKSVIDFVDSVIIFDTGSTDNTSAIVRRLVQEYPGKIIFSEKGECDEKRHTDLREEMLRLTKTDWFMILDGDEVWTGRAMEEAKKLMEEKAVTCLVAPFYLCVGDIYHRHRGKGRIKILGKSDFHYPRFIKIVPGLHWQGIYNQDTLLDGNNEQFCRASTSRFLSNRYWHLTHLRRSSQDDRDYSSGGSRKEKRRLTYFLMGTKINEPVPEVFAKKADELRMSWSVSLVNFFKLLFSKFKNS